MGLCTNCVWRHVVNVNWLVDKLEELFQNLASSFEVTWSKAPWCVCHFWHKNPYLLTLIGSRIRRDKIFAGATKAPVESAEEKTRWTWNWVVQRIGSEKMFWAVRHWTNNKHWGSGSEVLGLALVRLGLKKKFFRLVYVLNNGYAEQDNLWNNEILGMGSENGLPISYCVQHIKEINSRCCQTPRKLFECWNHTKKRNLKNVWCFHSSEFNKVPVNNMTHSILKL